MQVTLFLLALLLAQAPTSKYVITGSIFHQNKGAGDSQPMLLPLIYNKSGVHEMAVFATRAECQEVVDKDPDAQATFDRVAKLAASHGDTFIDVHCMEIPGLQPVGADA